MRISLVLTDRLEATKLVAIDPDSTHKQAFGEFYIDTGSPISVIGHELINRLDLPTTRLQYDDQGFIGGNRVNFAPVDDVAFTIPGEAGKISGTHTFHVPQYVRKPVDQIDSVLGMDFLAAINGDLHCQFSTNPPQAHIDVDTDTSAVTYEAFAE